MSQKAFPIAFFTNCRSWIYKKSIHTIEPFGCLENINQLWFPINPPWVVMIKRLTGDPFADSLGAHPPNQVSMLQWWSVTRGLADLKTHLGTVRLSSKAWHAAKVRNKTTADSGTFESCGVKAKVLIVLLKNWGFPYSNPTNIIITYNNYGNSCY